MYMTSIRVFSVVISLLFLAACGSKPEAKQEETPAPAVAEQPAPVEEVHPGKKVYNQYCIVCHMADGKGVAGLNPPLIQTEWVLGDKERLVKIILNGFSEKITVNGETYQNVMPSHAFLSDKDIADVLSYVRSSFGNTADAISTEEVVSIRAKKPGTIKNYFVWKSD